MGAKIDRYSRWLAIGATGLIVLAMVALGIGGSSSVVVFCSIAVWGLAWGGAPTLLQTAVGVAGGRAADEAQAMLVTLWNVAMAGGGVVGGLLLSGIGPRSLPWAALILLMPAAVVVVAARQHGFPSASKAAATIQNAHPITGEHQYG